MPIKRKSKTLTPPEHLDQTALEAWHSVCTDLSKLGALETVDAKLIEVYSQDYSLCKRVRDQLDDEELTMICENGRAFVNPLANLYSALSTKLRQTLVDLGLTPSARKGKPLMQDNDPYKGMRSGDI